MNGKTWRIALCVTMLEMGEDAATGADVAARANELFPHAAFPAGPVGAEWELSEFRKLLAFMRDPVVSKPPPLSAMLRWYVMRTDSYDKVPLGRDIVALRTNPAITRWYAPSGKQKPEEKPKGGHIQAQLSA